MLRDPTREVPPDSERLTVQFRLSGGSLSEEFVIDPKAALAGARDRTGAGGPAGSPGAGDTSELAGRRP